MKTINAKNENVAPNSKWIEILKNNFQVVLIKKIFNQIN